MVGHTHEDIDQVFSRISTHMRHVDAPTLPALLHGITESTTPTPEVLEVKGIYDYKSCFEDVRGMIEGISGPHQFMLKEKNGKVILHYKDWPTDAVYKTLDFSDRIPDDLNLMQVAVNPKMEVESGKMRNDLPKWNQSGRLSEENVEWWNEYLFIQEHEPNLPPVHQLPCYTETEQSRNSGAEHLVDAISASVERHKKQSVLRVKGKRRSRIS
ncbi:uncharacterized protein LOC123562516 [Mercenaria mercenaria]|uniref:uncharacterized protein LOC123562516 n=1 Tax=Mercenaria mercenaria TaxID=6596 RepID=UPI00234ED087|nr:uncharacterized protein LOC123562516 [Mercenaria mercenaria]